MLYTECWYVLAVSIVFWQLRWYGSDSSDGSDSSNINGPGQLPTAGPKASTLVLTIPKR